MRIIHTSDLHLFSPLGARLFPLEARSRRMELTDTFRRMIDAAEAEGAEAMIIAGDLFDSERITLSEAESIADAMARARMITFLYLPGNHEREVLRASGARLPDNLKIFGKEWTYFEVSGVTFAGRSEVSCGCFDTLSLDPKRRNVAVLHGSLADRCGKETVGRAEALCHPIDYLALGHYHSYSAEQLSPRTCAVYSGTPEGRGFDECGVKGYVRIDIDEWGVRHTLVPFAKRTLHIKEVDITGLLRESEIEERLREALLSIPSSDLVRAVLVGRREMGVRRETEALGERLGAGRFFLEVTDKTRLGIDPEDYKNDISLKGELIRLAYSREGLDEGERDEIIELGIRALMGEGL